MKPLTGSTMLLVFWAVFLSSGFVAIRSQSARGVLLGNASLELKIPHHDSCSIC
jgi:hypothetical protein